MHELPCWTPSRRPRRCIGVADPPRQVFGLTAEVDGLPLRVSAGLRPDFPCVGCQQRSRHYAHGRFDNVRPPLFGVETDAVARVAG